MANVVVIPTADREWLSHVAPATERKRVELWADIVTQFIAADDKRAAVEFLVREYGATLPVSQPTIYAKVGAWKAEGWVGLLRKCWRERYLAETCATSEFRAFIERMWKPLCERSQRVTAAAYRSLFFDHLRAGKVIEGYGMDWRGIWRADQRHPGMDPPEECPYAPDSCYPRGWSRRNLYHHAPDKFERSAARIGIGHASSYLPKIPSSRVMLPYGRVIVIDDMHHDVKVRLLGNREPQIVVEMRALELKTGATCARGVKPVREREDGTREYMRETFLRFLMADVLVNHGYHPDGLLVLGELGTARLPEDLLKTLNTWAGGTADNPVIEFEAGGIVDIPLAKGLFAGRGRGNFRFKAALESVWSLQKNELAMLAGQKGADPEHAPEDLEARVRHDKGLMTICHALMRDRPDLVDHIRGVFPSYHQYLEALSIVYDRIEHRHDHHLEGFEESGFVVPVWRLGKGEKWRPEAELDHMSAEMAEPIRALMRQDPALYTDLQVMSPAEASAASRARTELVRLPAAAVPDILGPTLGDVLPVTDDGTMLVPDRYAIGKRYPVAAIVLTIDGRKQLLPRKTKWLVHINPFDGRLAYVSTPEQQFVGVAPVMVAGSRIDRETMERNLGILQEVKTREVKRLTPFAELRLQELAENAEHDLTTITGENPIHAAQERAAHDQESAERARHTAGSAGDLLPVKAQEKEEQQEEETVDSGVTAPVMSVTDLFKTRR